VVAAVGGIYSAVVQQLDEREIEEDLEGERKEDCLEWVLGAGV
jgi:hypothetical protein